MIIDDLTAPLENLPKRSPKVQRLTSQKSLDNEKDGWNAAIRCNRQYALCRYASVVLLLMLFTLLVRQRKAVVNQLRTRHGQWLLGADARGLHPPDVLARSGGFHENGHGYRYIGMAINPDRPPRLRFRLSSILQYLVRILTAGDRDRIGHKRGPRKPHRPLCRTLLFTPVWKD